MKWTCHYLENLDSMWSQHREFAASRDTAQASKSCQAFTTCDSVRRSYSAERCSLNRERTYFCKTSAARLGHQDGHKNVHGYSPSTKTVRIGWYKTGTRRFQPCKPWPSTVSEQAGTPE